MEGSQKANSACLTLQGRCFLNPLPPCISSGEERWTVVAEGLEREAAYALADKTIDKQINKEYKVGERF